MRDAERTELSIRDPWVWKLIARGHAVGFYLGLLFLAITYLGTNTIFGPLAHVEQVMAILVILASLPSMPRSILVKTPQTLVLIGMAFAVFLSMLIGKRWPSGAIASLLVFIPSLFSYVVVTIHCTTLKRLRILLAMLFLIATFVIFKATTELRHVEANLPAASNNSDPAGNEAAATEDNGSQTEVGGENSYLVSQKDDAGKTIYRIRGQNTMNDPNDFAQFMVALLPLLFINWAPRKYLANLFFVLAPAGVLLTGIFLTHSRGALLALLAVLIMAGRKRIGAIWSGVIAAGTFAAANALHFTGDRDISAAAGAGRTSLWGAGLDLFRSHPLFGVGYGQMPDLIGQTAHNSVVVCAAELGLFGLLCWSAFLFSTLRDASLLSSADTLSVPTPRPAVNSTLVLGMQTVEEPVTKQEIAKAGRLLILSLTGFLAACWFLSRAYSTTLFMLGGLVEVCFEMALSRGMTVPRMVPSKLFQRAALLAPGLVVAAYAATVMLNISR